MKTEIMSITPEIAAEMLSRNHNNRALRSRVVDLYAADMTNGVWEETSQAITFDKDGYLLDGQHRLNAVVKSGQSINMVVVTDAPRSGMYDAGLSRSIVDRITMGGTDLPSSITNNFICAVCSYVIGMKNNKAKLSTAEVRSFMNHNREKLEILGNIIGTKRTIGITVAPVAAAMLSAIDGDVDTEKLHRFYEVLVTGVPTSDDERPIVALRNRLLTEGMGRGSSQSRVEQYKRTQYAIAQYFSGNGLFKSFCPRNEVYGIDHLFNY